MITFIFFFQTMSVSFDKLKEKKAALRDPLNALLDAVSNNSVDISNILIYFSFLKIISRPPALNSSTNWKKACPAKTPNLVFKQPCSSIAI